MLRRTVGISTLTCALGARAFLLPPGIASSDKTASLETAAVFPKIATVTIPCQDCAFSFPEEQDLKSDTSKDDWFWIQGGANELLLKFTVSEDGRHLETGGSALYPYITHSGLGANEASEKSPSALQIPAGASITDVDTGDTRSATLPVTSWNVRIVESHPASADDDEIIVIQYQISSVGYRGMRLDGVKITLLQTGSGELLIIDAQRTPNHLSLTEKILESTKQDQETSEIDLAFGDLRQSHRGYDGHRKNNGDMSKGCSKLPAPLCRLKNMVEGKIRKINAGKDCHGRLGFTHRGPMGLAKSDSPAHHRGRPHHMRPHMSHHGHYRGHHGRHGHFRQHGFMHFFAKGLVAVLIPIMAGVVVGMTVSFLGLIIGQLISFLWIKVVRGGRRGYDSIPVEAESFLDGEHPAEKQPFIAEMERPPVYEDAPPYETTPTGTIEPK